MAALGAVLPPLQPHGALALPPSPIPAGAAVPAPSQSSGAIGATFPRGSQQWLAEHGAISPLELATAKASEAGNQAYDKIAGVHSGVEVGMNPNDLAQIRALARKYPGAAQAWGSLVNPIEWGVQGVHGAEQLGHGVGELASGHYGRGALDVGLGGLSAAAVLPIGRGAKALRALVDSGLEESAVANTVRNLKVGATLARAPESVSHGKALQALGDAVAKYHTAVAEGAPKTTVDAAKAAVDEAKTNELFTRLHAQIKPTPVPQTDARYGGRAALVKGLIAGSKKSVVRGVNTALPPTAKNGPQLQRLMSFLDELTTRGMHGAHWYENSANDILRVTGNDPEKADKLAQFIGIYSPQQPILGNTSLAVRAWNEFQHTGDITVGTAPQRAKALDVMRGVPWEGRKTNNFYRNFAEDIWKGHPLEAGMLKHAGIHGREVTSDMWMARAFGYPTDAVSNGRYDAIEKIVQRIADERGMKPKQVQAAIWTAIKDASDDSSANIDFAKGFARHAGQINYEAALGNAFKSRLAKEYASWPPEVQRAFLHDHAQNVTQFLHDAGYLGGEHVAGPGVYGTERGIQFNPGAANEVLTSASPGGGYEMLPVERARMDMASAAIGRALKQDAVAWMRPYIAKSPGHADSFLADLGHTITDQQAQDLYRALNPDGVERFIVVHTKDGAMIRNVGGFEGNGIAMQKAIEPAIDRVLGPETSVKSYATDGNLVEHTDYERLLNGEGHAGNGGGSSEALRFRAAADRLASAAEGINRQYLGDQGSGFGDALRAGVAPAALAAAHLTGHHIPGAVDAAGLLAGFPGAALKAALGGAVRSEAEVSAHVEDAVRQAIQEGFGHLDVKRGAVQVAPGEVNPETGGELGQSVRESISGPHTKGMGTYEKAGALADYENPKTARAAQEALRSAERSRRLAAGQDAFEAAGGGVVGHEARMAELRGQYPQVTWNNQLVNLDQTQLTKMINFVNEHPTLDQWQKVRVPVALQKMIDGKLITASDQRDLEAAFGHQTVSDLKAALSNPDKRKLILDVLNVPRSLVASTDLSSPFRQAAVATVSHPVLAARAFGKMFRSVPSEKFYDGVMQDIHDNPYFPLAMKGDVAFTARHGVPLNAHEEARMSDLLEKIPGLGAMIRGSNRGFYVFLNKLRMDYFARLAEASARNGEDLTDPKVLHDIGSVVNWATGRGNAGDFVQKHLATFNALFFSPRLMMSRLQTFNPMFYAHLSPTARREAMLSVLKFGGTVTSILTLLKYAGLNVGTNPTSADFGKIKMGNTRIDIGGGYLPYLRLGAQLYEQKYTSSTTGITKALGSGFGQESDFDLIMRFLQSKLSPPAGMAVSALRGEDWQGHKLSLRHDPIGMLKSAGENDMLPFMAQDILTLYKNSGWNGLYASPLDLFGIGVTAYKAKASTGGGGGWGGGNTGGSGGWGGGSSSGSSGWGG